MERILLPTWQQRGYAANQKDHKQRIGEKKRKTKQKRKYFISTLLHITVPETAIYIECAGKRDQSTTLVLFVYVPQDILRTPIQIFVDRVNV